MKTKSEILDSMFRDLVSIGKIKTQQDLALAIGRDKTNVSSAFNGNERYLNEKLFSRINNSFGGIFSQSWIETGDGILLKKDRPNSHNPKNITDDFENQEIPTNYNLTSLQTKITYMERLIKQMEKNIELLERENETLKNDYRGAGTVKSADAS